MQALAGAWVISWGLLALALGVATDVLEDVYSARGVELPWLTSLLLAAGDALREGWGLLPVALGLAIGVAPVVAVPSDAALVGSRTVAWLVVPAPVAAGGTATALAYGAAVWVRLAGDAEADRLRRGGGAGCS